MGNIKKQAKASIDSTKRVLLNGEIFIQAVSLIVVAAFSYYALQQLEMNRYAEVVITAALVIIGLRGFVEFFKFLDKK